MPETTTNFGFKKPLKTESADIDVINSNFDLADEVLKEIIENSKDELVEINLLADGWNGDTYTLTVSGVTATSYQDVLPGLNITKELLEVLQGANIQDGGQSTDTIILKAFGDVPTVDVPIRVVLRGEG